jgi:ADP-ribosylglycohydrolase
LIVEKLILWRDTGYWTPDGEVVGVWNTAQEAVAGLKKRAEGTESCCLNSGEYVFNASLGWALPLAYVTYGLSPEQRIKVVTDIASLTNSHRRSNLACIMYNEIALRLLHGVPFDDSVVEVQEFMLNRFSEEEEMTHFARIMSGRIVSLRPHEINTSNYVIDTLEACVWTLLTTSSYREAVLTAVNLGHDTDTLGAITGGLAGILYGLETIPKDWFDKLVKRDKIEELCDLYSKRMEELETKRKGRSTTV